MTDNGPQFTSEDMRLFSLENGIKHIKSTPYIPVSNGEAERAVRTLMITAMIKLRCTLNQQLATYLLRN